MQILVATRRGAPTTARGRVRCAVAISSLNDLGHLSQRIRSHETSASHAEACVVLRAMAKQQDNRRNIARVLTRNNKFLAKGFGKIIKCYFDAGNVIYPFVGPLKKCRTKTRATFSLSFSSSPNMTVYYTNFDNFLKVLPNI